MIKYNEPTIGSERIKEERCFDCPISYLRINLFDSFDFCIMWYHIDKIKTDISN